MCLALQMSTPRRSRRSIGALGTVEVARGDAASCNGSIFTAQLAWPVRSIAAANAVIALMKQESCCASADHNMTAYRIGGNRKGVKVEKAYDDDGEAHGGQRLLGALTRANACNVAVVVSRVYGGVNIGKRRFELICETASQLLDACGHVPGVGIAHNWGEGHSIGGVLTGTGHAAPSSSGSSGSLALPGAASSSSAAPGSGGKKRKRDAAAEAEEQRRAQREAVALAAERRMAMQAAVTAVEGSSMDGKPSSTTDRR